MKNSVELSFDKTLVSLAGYKYGKETYEQQVKGRVLEEEVIEIIFPDNITRAASSFVQGFFSEWMEKYTLEEIPEKIHIITTNKSLCKSIYSDLF